LFSPSINNQNKKKYKCIKKGEVKVERREREFPLHLSFYLWIPAAAVNGLNVRKEG
jgi:hypothetical protein